MTWKILPLALAISAAACSQNKDSQLASSGDDRTGTVAADSDSGAAPDQPDGAARNDSDTGGDSGGVSNGGGDDDEMRWRFARTAAGPKLTYGEPNTDNVRLMLRCSGGDVALHFRRPADVVGRRPDQLTIASGGMQWRTGVSAEQTELGGMSITATAPLSSAPMTAFRSGQPLEVRWGDETIRVPGTQQAAQLLSACS